MQQFLSFRAVLFFGFCCAGACTDSVIDDESSQESDIRGSATTVSLGQFEAVVKVNGSSCTGTLITKEAVLTAAHCVCTPLTYPATLTCASTASVTFDDVFPVGSGTRSDVTVT